MGFFLFCTDNTIMNYYNSAIQVFIDELKQFDSLLSDNQELYLNIDGVLFHPITIRHSGEIIIYKGVSAEGGDVVLLQHYSRLNNLILSLAKPQQAEHARRVGFVAE